MEHESSSSITKSYLYGVIAIIVVLPLLSIVVEEIVRGNPPLSYDMIGKWFIFYSAGIRLFTAGIRQIFNPSFTAKDIFHLEDVSGFPIVRELGFANVSFGVIGILSLVFPGWRIVSGVGSGLFYGMAALNHYLKKPAGANEVFAMVTNVFVFLLLAAYVVEAI